MTKLDGEAHDYKADVWEIFRFLLYTIFGSRAVRRGTPCPVMQRSPCVIIATPAAVTAAGGGISVPGDSRAC